MREVKEKKLPELDDDFALDTADLDSLQELREEVLGDRLRDASRRSIETQFREAVLDAAVDSRKVEIDHDLVHAKAHEMWHETARRLPAAGPRPAAVSGLLRQEEELVTEAEPEAERAQARGGAGRGRRGEGIEVGDDELLDAMREPTAAGAAIVRTCGRRVRRRWSSPAPSSGVAMSDGVVPVPASDMSVVLAP